MASRTIHRKANGTQYVYEVTSYWDKKLKAPRNKQVCIGKIDEATGEVVPTGQRGRSGLSSGSTPVAKCQVIGPVSLLDAISLETGLPKILKRCFPQTHSQILSLAYFLVQKGLPLSRCETWSVSHRHPYGGELTSQRVSELLHQISESARIEFFKLWLAHLAENECFYYDITSVSSYSEQNEFVRYGYNRDEENLPQINLGMLFGQKSALPAFYRRLPGNISDVSTLKTTVGMLGHIGQMKLTFVLDRGFYSKDNVDTLFFEKMRFILACPSRKWNTALYEEHGDDILHYSYRHALSDNEVLYMKTIFHKWGNRRCYVHIYYNESKAASDRDEFALKLSKWREELTTGNEVKENVWAYNKYFIVKDLPKRGRKVLDNMPAIEMTRKKHMGFFCLLASYKTDAITAIETYRRKEAVENCFDDLKNMLDMKRLRIHSSPAMDARLFIQFIASVLLSKLRLMKNQHIKLKYISVRELMEHMETISFVKLSNKLQSIISEVGPVQRNVVDHFGLKLDT